MDAYWSALVNFMYQLDWAMRYPDIWSNIILSVALRVFSDVINTGINRLRKADCPPWCEWASSKHLKTWIEQKGKPFVSKKEPHLPTALRVDIGLFPSLDLNWNISSSWVSSLTAFRLELTYYWFSVFQTWTETAPSALLGFQPAWLQILGLLRLHNMNQFFIINLNLTPCSLSLYIHTHTDLTGFVSL